MATTITATQLRRNVYNILDQVLDSGSPQEILRNGRKLLLVPVEPKRRRFEDAPKRQILSCSFDELVATSWENAWEPDV